MDSPIPILRPSQDGCSLHGSTLPLRGLQPALPLRVTYFGYTSDRCRMPSVASCHHTSRTPRVSITSIAIFLTRSHHFPVAKL
jgi:hypothetical protein